MALIAMSSPAALCCLPRLVLILALAATASAASWPSVFPSLPAIAPSGQVGSIVAPYAPVVDPLTGSAYFLYTDSELFGVASLSAADGELQPLTSSPQLSDDTAVAPRSLCIDSQLQRMLVLLIAGTLSPFALVGSLLLSVNMSDWTLSSPLPLNSRLNPTPAPSTELHLLAVDSRSRLYIASPDVGIYVLDAALSQLPGAAGFLNISSYDSTFIRLAADGSLLLLRSSADSNSTALVRFDTNGTQLSSTALQGLDGAADGSVQGVAVDSERGSLYVTQTVRAGSWDVRLRRYGLLDGRLQSQSPVLPSSQQSFRGGDLTLTTDGGVWLFNWAEAQLLRCSPQGSWTSTITLRRLLPPELALRPFGFDEASNSIIGGRTQLYRLSLTAQVLQVHAMPQDWDMDACHIDAAVVDPTTANIIIGLHCFASGNSFLVSVFNAAFQQLCEWPVIGGSTGQPMRLDSVSHDRLYIACFTPAGDPAIAAYSIDGSLLFFFSTNSSLGQPAMPDPSVPAQDVAGNLYIIPSLSALQLLKFDRAGQYLASIPLAVPTEANWTARLDAVGIDGQDRLYAQLALVRSDCRDLCLGPTVIAEAELSTGSWLRTLKSSDAAVDNHFLPYSSLLVSNDGRVLAALHSVILVWNTAADSGGNGSGNGAFTPLGIGLVVAFVCLLLVILIALLLYRRQRMDGSGGRGADDDDAESAFRSLAQPAPRVADSKMEKLLSHSPEL